MLRILLVVLLWVNIAYMTALANSVSASDKLPVIKLQPKVVVQPNPDAVTTIPLASVKAFMTRTRVVDQEEYLNAPYVLALNGDHLVATDGNKIFVRGIKDPHITHYDIVHEESKYFDPLTRQVIGYEAVFVAEATLVQATDPAVMQVQHATQRVAIGDRLLPHEELDEKDFLPHAPKKIVKGQILDVAGGISSIGAYDTVALNVGQTMGVDRGTVLYIYKNEEAAIDPVTKQKVQLPDLMIGKLIILKVAKNKPISYGLILSATQEITLGDYVKS